jgi:hypothetical protein
MTHLHLTIVVEVYNGTRIKQAMNLLSKTLNFGLMKVIGNGQQNQIRERKHLLVGKYFANARKRAINFIKRPEGDMENQN